MRSFSLVSFLLVLVLFSGQAYSAEAPFWSIAAPAGVGNPRNSEGDIVELNDVDGTLLFAYSAFYGPYDGSAADIEARTSTDGGHTWSAPYILQSKGTATNVMSASLSRLQSGELMFIYLEKGNGSACRGWVRKSYDEAVTWTTPVAMTPAGGFYGINNDRILQLSTGPNAGRIIVPTKVMEEVRRSFVMYSDDLGATWTQSAKVPDIPGGGTQNFNEPGAVELSNGRLLMYGRTSMGWIYSSYSEDQGETWSAPEPMILVSPIAPMTMEMIPSTGDLMMVWNESNQYRTPLRVAISQDEGARWEHAKNIEDDPNVGYGYTSITFVGDRVMMTYYDQPIFGELDDRPTSEIFFSAPLSYFYEGGETIEPPEPPRIVAMQQAIATVCETDGEIRLYENDGHLFNSFGADAINPNIALAVGDVTELNYGSEIITIKQLSEPGKTYKPLDGTDLNADWSTTLSVDNRYLVDVDAGNTNSLSGNNEAICIVSQNASPTNTMVEHHSVSGSSTRLGNSPWMTNLIAVASGDVDPSSPETATGVEILALDNIGTVHILYCESRDGGADLVEYDSFTCANGVDIAIGDVNSVNDGPEIVIVNSSGNIKIFSTAHSQGTAYIEISQITGPVSNKNFRVATGNIIGSDVDEIVTLGQDDGLIRVYDGNGTLLTSFGDNASHQNIDLDVGPVTPLVTACDSDHNGIINFYDAKTIADNWLNDISYIIDIQRDGKMNILDFRTLAEYWRGEF